MRGKTWIHKQAFAVIFRLGANQRMACAIGTIHIIFDNDWLGILGAGCHFKIMPCVKWIKDCLHAVTQSVIGSSLIGKDCVTPHWWDGFGMEQRCLGWPITK